MNRLAALIALIFTLLACSGPPLLGHDTRPAALNLIEQRPGQFSVEWRQPIANTRNSLSLEVLFPPTCSNIDKGRYRQNIDGWLVETWAVECLFDHGEITFKGSALIITDVFVQIDFQYRPDINILVNASAPSLILGSEGPITTSAYAYLGLGVDHIITGYDHILFTIGLLLLVGGRRILTVLLAFTVAHGVTIVLTISGTVPTPSLAIEILIALSLVLLAKEILAKEQGQSGLTSRWPILITFGFGLVHGAGFAGALVDIGLPTSQRLTALALFNVGVEIGQIAVLALYALAVAGITRIRKSAKYYIQTASIYSIGSIGMYWVLIRSWSFIT